MGIASEEVVERELQPLLTKLSSQVRYADVRLTKHIQLEVALREESFETKEESIERVTFRALDKGYGLASTDMLTKDKMELAAASALKQAKSFNIDIQLAPVRQENGEYEHPIKKPLELEDVRRLLLYLRQLIKSKLGSSYSSSELILTHSRVESSFMTSEGTRVTERASYTDLVLYLVVREASMGYASKIIGGKGGMELVEERGWESITSELVSRAKDYTKAGLLSPLVRGRRFKVILDEEASGTVAHEIAHLLEAHTFQSRFFHGLNVPEDLELIDNPHVPRGYGSFMWDDEGVRGSKKTLLKRGSLQLLHTRMTAGANAMPGNAHGMNQVPKPLVSNIYIQPSDWQKEEIFQETGSGIYVRGVLRADTDLSDGRFELCPEIAYVVEKKEVKAPIRHLKIVDNIRSLIQRIDAIGKVAQLRPNMEKGFAIAEGGPHIRINGVHCL